MSAAVSRSEHQRAIGSLRLAIKRRGAASVLDVLHQDGCLKARFPRPGAWLEAVTLNSSGGVAGGDRLDTAITLGPGARATLASQAAERFYRALPGDPPAQVRARIALGAGAAAEWLPQESILFDRAALDRVLEIDLAPDAAFLGLETLVFGRTASGERVSALRLSDTIRLRRDGKLLLHDAVRLSGDVAAVLARPAIAAGCAAVATLIRVAPDTDAQATAEALRAVLACMPVEAGVSVRDGMLIGRLVAADAMRLRAAVAAALGLLRPDRPLPRVWLT